MIKVETRRRFPWLALALVTLFVSLFAVRFVKLPDNGSRPSAEQQITPAAPGPDLPPPVGEPQVTESIATEVATTGTEGSPTVAALEAEQPSMADETSVEAGEAETAAPPDPTLTESTETAEGEIDSPLATDGLEWREHLIQSGENLADIFKQQGLNASTLHRMVNSGDVGASLAKVRPGQQLRFGLTAEGGLQQLELVRDQLTSLHFTANEDGFEAEEVRLATDKRLQHARGTIASSLFVDGQQVGLDDSQIMEMAEMFGWDIDFALELREGDSFQVIYEEELLNGEKVRNGKIIAAEFTNQGNTYRAYRHSDSSGVVSYYDEAGRNKKRAFIRTPVKYARVSSGFTTRRWHPVLKTWRSHKGVDYAAPTGTPVRATGSGSVSFIGNKGGYGKVIFLKHGGKYTTVYGHLNAYAKSLKSGARVRQGQIIGYVGKTGLATGPHLHYEFRVHGVHRNPLTVKLPLSEQLPDAELAAFRLAIQDYRKQLDSQAAPTLIARAPE